VPARTFELKKNLQKPVDFKGMDDKNTTLQEALDFLADRYDLTFDVNDQAFKAEMIDDVMSKGIAADKPIPKMKNVSLETVLRRILARVPYPGTTYIIRRDAIEITTLKAVALEKTVRAYPVADLVVPIPNSINAQSVQQAGSIFGYFGAAGVQGGFNGLQGVQGGIGGFNGFGGFAGFAGLGGGFGGQLGGAQFGLQGGLNVAGGFGGMGNVNLGVGGGALGFGGGQLGQFGNLGGQFGLQGGTQQVVLMDLIRQVVGYPRDWVPRNAGGLAAGGNLGPGPGGQPDDTSGDQETGNALGYFPAALALVVKGTSRIHTRAGGPGYNPLPPVQGAMERDGVIRIDGGRDKKKNTKIGPGEDTPNKSEMKTKRPPLADADPKTIWQEALARGIEDPGIIIATADYLVDAGRFDHAAEFLKANLRQGILVKPWVYEALAVALKESKASPEEVERAETSEADLVPQDAQGFLRAALALAEHKNYERALGFCRQAAALEPNVPYAYEQALSYAAQLKDTEAMEWASGNLMKRDWPVNNQDLQNKAKDKLASLAKSLDSDNNKPAAEKLRSAMAKLRERDLVIRLTWQGEADLDLKVQEPNGSVCSWLNRQTVGGGVLIGDTLGEVGTETYVAAQAFPGAYKVTVEQVWGRPLGGKAKVEVIRHQGTAKETIEATTVSFSNTNTLTVRLDDGRRTEAAAVPPPSAVQKPAPVIESNDRDRVWAQLRALSEPSENGTGLRGDIGAAGSQSARETVRATDGGRGEQMAYQTRVQPFVSGSVNLTAQATISSDRRYVRLSVAPMFTGVTGTQQQPNVVLPLIPGNP
jgi:tetratricopeptide (TPR) repeat protein